MLIVRSVVYNILFYLNLMLLLIVAIPTLVLPYRAIIAVAKFWGRSNLWLLRLVCGTRVEFRGLEKISPGALLVAAKHQSTWETFVLVTLFDDPVFIIKRELQWLPFFGWYAIKGRQIPVNRGARGQALIAMTERARIELSRGRQLIIFPEGTRRPAGAEPQYKYGVTHLYAATGVACLPIALNSGLFWPRRSFLRYPGTIRVEILDPIKPGLDKEAFSERLRDDIETATARLIAQGERELAEAGVIVRRRRRDSRALPSAARRADAAHSRDSRAPRAP